MTSVLVVGPPLSGVSGLVAALGARLPDVVVAEAGGGAPDVVLAVGSAVAPLTRSDWAVAERAAAAARFVIGVVSKVDAHHRWRDVLAVNRALVASWDPRCRSVPWVGVAAAPGLGAVRVDDLVDLLRDYLLERNALPPEFIRSSAARRGPDPAECRRVLQRSRLEVVRVVRNRSAELRAELRAAAARMGSGGSAGFEARVACDAREFHARVSEELDRVVRAAAAELRTTVPPAPASVEPPEPIRTATSSRRLEGRLAAVLGVGLGLGVTLASGRLMAGMMPGWSAASWAAGAAAGLILVVWMVRARGLLAERALLDRWVVEVVATLVWHGETMVAERLLAVESRWAAGARRPAQNGVWTRRQLTRHDVTDQYEWC